MKPHAAAERAMHKWASAEVGGHIEDYITREYAPLVAAVREAPEFGGEPMTAFGAEYQEWLADLRAALRRVVGDE